MPKSNWDSFKHFRASRIGESVELSIQLRGSWPVCIAKRLSTSQNRRRSINDKLAMHLRCILSKHGLVL